VYNRMRGMGSARCRMIVLLSILCVLSVVYVTFPEVIYQVVTGHYALRRKNYPDREMEVGDRTPRVVGEPLVYVPPPSEAKSALLEMFNGELCGIERLSVHVN